MNNIEKRYTEICEKVNKIAQQNNRNPSDVTLLAVSKTYPASEIRKVAALGCQEFAESYIQEASEKIDSMTDLELNWHFIGPIQSNKTKDIANRFSWLHSLDRLKIAKRLQDQRSDDLPPLNVCIQVNVSNDPNKSGILLSEVSGFAQQLETFSKLTLRGLMAVPALNLSSTELESQFSRLNDSLKTLKTIYPDCDTLSLGMSADMDTAIRCGSTMVRIGSAIFGQRTKKVN